MMDSIFIDSLQIFGTGTSARFNLLDFKGLGNPDPRSNRPERSRRHGLYDLTTFYGGRAWDGNMWISGATSTDWSGFWTAYDSFMQSTGYGTPTKVLTFTRKGLAYSEFSTITMEEDMRPEFLAPSQPICKVPFSAMAGDPRLYATTLSTVSFAASGNATNGGNFNTSPLIRFNGAGTNPGLRNNALTTENEINILYTMGGGDVIEVDSLARTVKLNGTLRPDILVSSTSSFWGLVSGVNNLTKLGGAVSVDVEWHDGRIG